VLSAPVGGVDEVRREQKGQDGRKFNRQMGGEVLCDASAPRVVDEDIEVILQMPTRDGDAVGRHRPCEIPVTHAQGALQHELDPRREMGLVLIADERMTPPQQVRETGLMDRVRKPAIRRLAIAH
jgi:hypothetical protein